MALCCVLSTCSVGPVTFLTERGLSGIMFEPTKTAPPLFPVAIILKPTNPFPPPPWQPVPPEPPLPDPFVPSKPYPVDPGQGSIVVVPWNPSPWLGGSMFRADTIAPVF